MITVYYYDYVLFALSDDGHPFHFTNGEITPVLGGFTGETLVSVSGAFGFVG